MMAVRGRMPDADNEMALRNHCQKVVEASPACYPESTHGAYSNQIDGVLLTISDWEPNDSNNSYRLIRRDQLQQY